MNRNRLKILATVLEMAAKPTTKPKIGFNMSDYASPIQDDNTGHHCGTTACIAGWAVVAFGNVSVEGLLDMPVHIIENQARELLDLTLNESDALFLPAVSRNEVKPYGAARVLRHAARTGKINWREKCP